MPKRGPSSSDQQPTKRLKQARSATPAEPGFADIPFYIVYPSRGFKNAKKAPPKDDPPKKHVESQKIPFVARDAVKDNEMDIEYAIAPYEEWSSMRKYTNFIIQQETYTNNEFVFVKSSKIGNDPKSFWIARILQVRAKDPQHVYALVTWMYWPEELPIPKSKVPDQVNIHSGKRKYHANNELVASNYLDVLDVLSLAGKAEVTHWEEEGDTQPTTLFWRQTLNQKTDQLSDIRRHCVCETPRNPDLSMYICDNPDCKTMLHPGCLTDMAARKKYEELVPPKTKSEESAQGTAKTNGAKKKGDPEDKREPTKGEWNRRFKAEIVAVGEEGQTRMVITDLMGEKEKGKAKKGVEHGDLNGSTNGHRATKWEERVFCPICEHALE